MTTFAGELLWCTETMDVLSRDQRLFASPMFGHIFVSCADSAAVLRTADGSVSTVVRYPALRRGRETASHDPMYSVYAQSGYSVWDVRRVGGRAVVVYDMERVNPVMADFINIL